MRGVWIAILGLALSGCATMSVYPSEIASNESVSEEQIRLRQSAAEFCTEAEAAGWVTRAPGLLQAAQSLFEGRAARPDEARTYAASLDIETRAPADVLADIGADVQQARADLAGVNAQARTFLANLSVPTARADVMGLEKTLVWAQKAHRAFAGAIDMATRTGGAGSTDADQALSALAAEIDETRRLADALAARYSGSGAPAGS